MTAARVVLVERDLQGLKHVRSLRKLLARLHEAGTQRDAAGNRQLHMDQEGVPVRLFNPAIRRLRGLQRTTECEEIRKRLGVNRTSPGPLSESVRIFAPTVLAGIAEQLPGGAHLLATRQQGVELQMYFAIIACLLIVLYTGCQPNVTVFEAICFCLMGRASFEELEARIPKSPLHV